MSFWKKIFKKYSDKEGTDIDMSKKYYSYDFILKEVKKSIETEDDNERSRICISIVELNGNCLSCLLEIVKNNSLDFIIRRWALKIASGFRGEKLEEFIKQNCIAGKSKSDLMNAYNSFGDAESFAALALYNTGEEILDTKNFFELFISKTIEINNVKHHKPSIMVAESELHKNIQSTNKLIIDKPFSVMHRKGKNSIKSVIIGNQEWQLENLNVDKFRNGDSIKHANNRLKWTKAGEEETPAFCYFKHEIKNGTRYGKLYNWYAVSDPRGLAPEGWHIPSTMEWNQLKKYLGGDNKEGTRMKSTTGWQQPVMSWQVFDPGTNTSGFSALPGGMCDHNGVFYNEDSQGNFWSITMDENYITWHCELGNDSAWAPLYGGKYGNGYSVRCIKD